MENVLGKCKKRVTFINIHIIEHPAHGISNTN